MSYSIGPLTYEVVKRHLDALMFIDKDTDGERWERAHFAFELPEKWVCSRIALDDLQNPVGFIVASLKGQMVHVHRFVVEQSHRGRGLGSSLLREVAEYAGHRSIPEMTLKVARQNTEAIRYYIGLGFFEIETGSNNLGLSVSVPSLLARIKTGVDSL